MVVDFCPFLKLFLEGARKGNSAPLRKQIRLMEGISPARTFLCNTASQSLVQVPPQPWWRCGAAWAYELGCHSDFLGTVRNRMPFYLPCGTSGWLPALRSLLGEESSVEKVEGDGRSSGLLSKTLSVPWGPCTSPLEASGPKVGVSWGKLSRERPSWLGLPWVKRKAWESTRKGPWPGGRAQAPSSSRPPPAGSVPVCEPRWMRWLTMMLLPKPPMDAMVVLCSLWTTAVMPPSAMSRRIRDRASSPVPYSLALYSVPSPGRAEEVWQRHSDGLYVSRKAPPHCSHFSRTFCPRLCVP